MERCTAIEQNEAKNAATEISLRADSKESKESKRGGKRRGAGRPPDLTKRMISRLKPATALELLSTVDIQKHIRDIFAKGSLSLKQKTMADLMDRAWGRPAQAVNVSGAVVHAHWTPGKYSHLTDEEFAKLAELSAKALGPPTTQNAPHNQMNNQMNQSQPIAEVV